MKDLLSKEHYCHKSHTLCYKSGAYPPPPPSKGKPPCMDYTPTFQRNWRWRVHTMNSTRLKRKRFVIPRKYVGLWLEFVLFRR